MNGKSRIPPARVAALDTSFSWRSVAANAVTASTSSAVVGRMNGALKIDVTTTGGQFAQDLLGGAVGGATAVRRAEQTTQASNQGDGLSPAS